MPEFPHIQHGTLPSGTVTELGTITAVSCTAYEIAGEWHPFVRLHGPRRPILQPLVACSDFLPHAN